MLAVDKLRAAYLGQPQIHFIDQAGGLEGMAGILMAQESGGDGAKIVVGESGYAGERFPVSGLPALQHACDLARHRSFGRHRFSPFRSFHYLTRWAGGL